MDKQRFYASHPIYGDDELDAEHQTYDAKHNAIIDALDKAGVTDDVMTFDVRNCITMIANLADNSDHAGVIGYNLSLSMKLGMICNKIKHDENVDIAIHKEGDFDPSLYMSYNDNAGLRGQNIGGKKTEVEILIDATAGRKRYEKIHATLLRWLPKFCNY